MVTSKAAEHRNFITFYKEAPDAFKIALLSLALVVFSFLLQGHIGINLSDEGFLWYGTVQTASGEVPLRDFQSYDPGRYYWGAFWSIFLGRGIIALRISAAIFQWIGLTLGLLVLREVVRSWRTLAVAALLLLVWMFPRHKLFDLSLSLAAVYVAFHLVKKPSLGQHFLSGVFIGLAAFFGHNHGLYNFLAFSALILFIWLRIDRGQLVKRIGSWLAGILLGYSPMLVMMLTISGFFESFVSSIMFLLRIRRTNIPLPIPWPWRSAVCTGSFVLLFPLL